MKLHVVKCAVCGKEFETTSTRQCCSEECLKVKQREYQRQYKQRGRQKRAERKERTAAGKKLTCAICGKEITAKGKYKYCSEACQKVANARYHAAYQAANREAIREKDRARKRKPVDPEAPMIYQRVCPQCGKWFRTMYRQKTFCGKRCKDRWNQTAPERRIDMRAHPEMAKMQAAEARRQIEEERARKAEEERRQKYQRDRVRRTESGAVWYPVSGSEIQRIARETHRTYGEVCAEFLSQQVRGTAGGRTE